MFIKETQNPSAYIKDQSLSIEVEEWLKNNSPTVLARGQSTARSGYKCTVNPRGLIISEEESRKRIEEQNRIVRENKAKARRNKRVSDILFKELIEHIYSNAGHGDLPKIAKALGMNDSMIPNARKNGFMTEASYKKIKGFVETFEFKPKPKPRVKTKVVNHTLYITGVKLPPTRQMSVKLRRIEAEEMGQKYFDAPCIKHGMTKFMITTTGSRCCECRKKMTKRQNDKRKSLQQSQS